MSKNQLTPVGSFWFCTSHHLFLLPSSKACHFIYELREKSGLISDRRELEDWNNELQKAGIDGEVNLIRCRSPFMIVEEAYFFPKIMTLGDNPKVGYIIYSPAYTGWARYDKKEAKGRRKAAQRWDKA